MNYTLTDLAVFLILYGFLGWICEVVFAAVVHHRYENRGFFNLPICPEYGIMADILIVILPYVASEFKVRNVILQFVIVLVVVTVVDFITGFIARRIWRRKFWHYEENTLLSGQLKGSIIGIARAAVVGIVVKVLHPFVYVLIQLLPVLLLRIIVFVIFGFMLIDLVFVLVAIYKGRRSPEDMRETAEIREYTKYNTQGRFGGRIFRFVWKRLMHAYPAMGEYEKRDEQIVFAKGVCFDKLVWVFLSTALIGDLFETLWVGIGTGNWMSRASVIYGPFSIVWGFGGVILTIILQRLADKADRYVFIAGMIIGGVYEYTCSVLSEVIFGRTFWDYSDMPFNFGGRTNLLFCIFWGLLAVFWVKILYPAISKVIEMMHPIYAKVITWVIVVFMVADLLLSAAVLVRYSRRADGVEPQNALAVFIDNNYSDSFVEVKWQNMRLPGAEDEDVDDTETTEAIQ